MGLLGEKTLFLISCWMLWTVGKILPPCPSYFFCSSEPVRLHTQYIWGLFWVRIDRMWTLISNNLGVCVCIYIHTYIYIFIYIYIWRLYNLHQTLCKLIFHFFCNFWPHINLWINCRIFIISSNTFSDLFFQYIVYDPREMCKLLCRYTSLFSDGCCFFQKVMLF